MTAHAPQEVDLRPAPPRRAGGACESSAPPHATGMCDVMSMWVVGGLASDSTTTSAYFYDPQFLGTWCSCGVGPAGVFVDQNCAALYGYVRLLGADDGTSAILKRKRRLFDHRWQCEENKRK
jgi:hypothetical protein